MATVSMAKASAALAAMIALAERKDVLQRRSEAVQRLFRKHALAWYADSA